MADQLARRGRGKPTPLSSKRRKSPSRASQEERRLTAAEFFAGIGLVRLALERHGFRVAFANDIDEDKLEIYHDNFGADDFHLGDIHQLSADRLPTCDLFTASFPCNDLSVAGARAGLAGGQSSAFWGFIRILRELEVRRPNLVLLENVPGFLTSHGGRDFQAALKALNELGYSCDAFLLDAARFVPQSRLRLFVVAKLGEAARPAAGLEPSSLRSEALVAFMRAHREIGWSVEPLPEPPRRQTDLASILDDLPDDDTAWWSRERAAYFINQLSERHLAIAREMIDGGTLRYGAAFRRVRKGRSMAELRVDGMAGCLRTPRGGSGRQILFKAGKGRYQVRLFTARECARLQGAPESYQINTRLNQALFGFGDAVCVPVIEWIAEQYLRPYLNRRVAENGAAAKA